MWANLSDFRQGGGLSKEDFEDFDKNFAGLVIKFNTPCSPQGEGGGYIQMACGPPPPGLGQIANKLESP